MDDETKTERVQLLMTPSEVRAIDDWGWERRIRTRAEAIRQLVAKGMTADQSAHWIECAESLYLAVVGAHKTGEASDALLEEANDLFGRASGAAAHMRGEPPGDPV